MQYVIVLGIIIFLAIADFITGIIKAYVKNNISSSKMRKGGLNKLATIIVQTVSIGLEIGLNFIGKYYGHADFTNVLGKFTVISVFTYIVIMEIISLLENYIAINPNAKWANGIIKRLKDYESEDNKNDFE